MTPMATLATITASPSHTYGRHHSSSPHNRAIQMPQATVEKARIRPMAGEASRTRREGFVPAQNSIANRMAMNTTALPRSGCCSTSADGTPTITPGGGQPRRLLLPDRGPDGRPVRPASCVERRETVDEQGDDHGDEGLIEPAEAWQHECSPVVRCPVARGRARSRYPRALPVGCRARGA